RATRARVLGAWCWGDAADVIGDRATGGRPLPDLRAEQAMDEAAKRTVLRMFNYILCAVTVPGPDGGHGFTANWIAQAAFEPPMLSISVENDSTAIGLLRAAGVFAVNVFAGGQRELAGQLGRRSQTHPDKFRGVPS